MIQANPSTMTEVSYSSEVINGDAEKSGNCGEKSRYRRKTAIKAGQF